MLSQHRFQPSCSQRKRRLGLCQNVMLLLSFLLVTIIVPSMTQADNSSLASKKSLKEIATTDAQVPTPPKGLLDGQKLQLTNITTEKYWKSSIDSGLFFDIKHNFIKATSTETTENFLRYESSFRLRGNFEYNLWPFLGLSITPQLTVANEITSQKQIQGKMSLGINQLYATLKVIDNAEHLVALRLGRMFVDFGRSWDFSFIGPDLLALSGHKMQTDYGFDVRGDLFKQNRMSLHYQLQYLPWDGNWPTPKLSLDAKIIPNHRHDHVTVLQLGPNWNFSESKSIHLYGSFLHQWQDQNSNKATAELYRYANDFSWKWSIWEGFAEWGFQQGTSHIEKEIIDTHQYLWLGNQVHLGPVSVRYQYSMRLLSEKNMIDLFNYDMLHQPGLTYRVNNNVSLVIEPCFQRNRQGDWSSRLLTFLDLHI